MSPKTVAANRLVCEAR